MLDAPESLPDDATELKALVLSQQAGMRRHRFGARSEALDQLELLWEGEEIAAAAEARVETSSEREPKAQPKRKPLSAHLPLYRQSQIYGCEAIEIELSTLADWVDRRRGLGAHPEAL